MYVKEINEVKKQLDQLKSDGLIENWELPYENLLTRLSAAIFFLTPVKEEMEPTIWKELSKQEDFSFRLNQEKKLSGLMYRFTFEKAEKEKNLQRMG
jgi:hypothetical protein